MLKSRSPSACAWKSYRATTYCTAGFGFGFNGGGGGGARFTAADVLEFWGVYGGGAVGAVGGGGGAFFVNVEGERETEDNDELVEEVIVFARVAVPPGRVAIILAIIQI